MFRHLWSAVLLFYKNLHGRLANLNSARVFETKFSWPQNLLTRSIQEINKEEYFEYRYPSYLRQEIEAHFKCLGSWRNLVFSGPLGSGRRTMIRFLSGKYGVPVIDVWDWCDFIMSHRENSGMIDVYRMPFEWILLIPDIEFLLQSNGDYGVDGEARQADGLRPLPQAMRAASDVGWLRQALELVMSSDDRNGNDEKRPRIILINNSGESGLRRYRNNFPRAHDRTEYFHFDDGRCLPMLLEISRRGPVPITPILVARMMEWVYRCYFDQRFKHAMRLLILTLEEIELYLQVRFPNFREMMRERPLPDALQASHRDLESGENSADIAIEGAYTRMREENPPDLYQIEIPCLFVIAQAVDLESMAINLRLNSDGRYDLMDLYKSMFGKSLAFDWHQVDHIRVHTNRTLDELRLFGRMALQGLEVVNDAMQRGDGNVLNDISWLEKFDKQLKDRLKQAAADKNQEALWKICAAREIIDNATNVDAFVRALDPLQRMKVLRASVEEDGTWSDFRDLSGADHNNARLIGGANAWLSSKLVITRRQHDQIGRS